MSYYEEDDFYDYRPRRHSRVRFVPVPTEPGDRHKAKKNVKDEIKALKDLLKIIDGKKKPEEKKDEKKPTLFKPWEVAMILCLAAIPIALMEGAIGKMIGVAARQLVFGP